MKLKFLFLSLFISLSTQSWAYYLHICIDGIYYSLYDDATAVVWKNVNGDYTGAIVIPSSVTYLSQSYSVTEIDAQAFNNSAITSVTIPNSITKIKDNSFLACSSLASVTISNSVTSIGNRAFGYCTSLTSISIPNSVTSIGPNAFTNCTSLASITIPNSVTSIGNYAFEGCTSLTSITIPNSVTSIESHTFYDCTSLTSINIPNNVTSIGDEAFKYCKSLATITIPNSVVSIGKNAFSGCTSLPIEDNIRYADTYLIEATDKTQSSYIIREGTKWIGTGAFYQCSYVQSIIIPNGVKNIGDKTFYDCTWLNSVTIPNSVTGIGEYAFSQCKWMSKIICKAIYPPVCGENCFEDVGKWTSCYVHVPITSINKYQSASEWHNLYFKSMPTIGACGDSIYFEISNDTLTLSGVGDMYDYNLPTFQPWNTYHDSINAIIIGNGITSIGNNAFSHYSELKSVVLPNSLQRIGNYAFANCFNKEYNSFVLPNSVQKIGNYAFANCDYLKKITFGTDLETIGDYAFDNDQKLIYITCLASEAPFLGTSPFTNYSAYLKVPCETLDEYKVSIGWKSFYNISCVSAEEDPAAKLEVTSGENYVTIQWPTDPDAETYSIDIYKDDKVFCTLTFNAQGQLLNIAYAPGRGNSNDMTAVAIAGGYKFTITSLYPGTSYAYNIDTKNASGTTIQNYTGTFKTLGTSAIDEISSASQPQVTKSICNGQLYILRDDKTYNAQGAEVK